MVFAPRKTLALFSKCYAPELYLYGLFRPRKPQDLSILAALLHFDLTFISPGTGEIIEKLAFQGFYLTPDAAS